jgi:hypothetical protein
MVERTWQSREVHIMVARKQRQGMSEHLSLAYMGSGDCQV